MSTKAVHLEMVTNMTTEAFIACFKRFMARRGRASNFFSDNGKTYVGASAEFAKFFKAEYDKT